MCLFFLCVYFCVFIAEGIFFSFCCFSLFLFSPKTDANNNNNNKNRMCIFSLPSCYLGRVWNQLTDWKKSLRLRFVATNTLSLLREHKWKKEAKFVSNIEYVCVVSVFLLRYVFIFILSFGIARVDAFTQTSILGALNLFIHNLISFSMLECSFRFRLHDSKKKKPDILVLLHFHFDETYLLFRFDNGAENVNSKYG